MGQFHTFKNLPISISLEAAELLEHVQWFADSRVSDTIAEKIDEVSAEMADIAIYLGYLAHDLGVDLDRLYPCRSGHFSPLGRVATDFLADKFFQNVAMHVKYWRLRYQRS
ncbi:MazG-like family protein [Thiocapsa bogorovii]|uniref:MazG-like family protein n=1 Tax=Thiocapsa bogorovii TaxID=521689 RepID=UPI001E57C7CF|nr:MazG-like family protein [Thiocapsa bogorovii]UHD18367.1 hypothetical protein LT988_10180 [Thiocapsa bogorovii]